MNRFIVKTLIVLVIVGIPLFGFSDTEEFLVNTYTSNAQQLQSIAMDDAGNFVITWTSDGQDGYGWGVYAKRFKSDGTPDGSEFQVNTTTNSNEGCPSVAMDSVGNFVIAWDTDGQDGSGYGVFTQRFDNSGNPVGSEFQVNTYTESVQRLANITMANNRNFVITWPSWGQDYPSTNGIFAQLYDKFGNPVGSEFQVNTFAEFNQTSPTAAFNSAGDFIIAWDSGDWNGNGDDYWAGVFAQRFDSSGNPIGSEFQVNTYTIHNQYDPHVAMDSKGNFTIVWQSYNQYSSTSGWDIYARQYNIVTPAIINLDLNVFNLKSKGNYITCYIELTGQFNANNIDQTKSITLVNNSNTFIAYASPREIGDYDSDGKLDLMVKFDRQAIYTVLTTGYKTLTVKGYINGGFVFEGNITVFVKNQGVDHNDEQDHSSVKY